MNRRNFMKIVGGTLAGVAFVPKAKPQLTVAMLQKVKKDLDAQKAKSEGHFELYNAFGNKILWIKGDKWPPRVIKVCDDKGVEFEYIPKDDRRKEQENEQA